MTESTENIVPFHPNTVCSDTLDEATYYIYITLYAIWFWNFFRTL